nr:uncharacterized protein LOC113715824 [Coffea arabica]
MDSQCCDSNYSHHCLVWRLHHDDHRENESSELKVLPATMASSSHRGESWNSLTSFSIENKFCHCNRKATVMISESEKNLDKLYFRCAKCRYFEWYDGGEKEEVNSKRSNLNAKRGLVKSRNRDGILVKQVEGPMQEPK